jgi:hypothetical protein
VPRLKVYKNGIHGYATLLIDNHFLPADAIYTSSGDVIGKTYSVFNATVRWMLLNTDLTFKFREI